MESAASLKTPKAGPQKIEFSVGLALGCQFKHFTSYFYANLRSCVNVCKSNGEVRVKLDSKLKGKQLSEMGRNMFDLSSGLLAVCFLRGTWCRLFFWIT